MAKSIIAGIIASFQIAVLFIILFIFYGALLDSPLSENPQSQEVLESGQQATIDAFNWWIIIDGIAFLIFIALLIFGIIYAVIKVVENQNLSGFGGAQI